MKCPCGTNQDFNQCCGLYIQSEELAPTPEKLMRSRYSAFVKLDFDHLKATIDPQVFDPQEFQENCAWAQVVQFNKLEILRSEENGNKGLVEFKAYFVDQEQKEQIHHEISTFRKQAGRWYFRGGKYPR